MRSRVRSGQPIEIAASDWNDAMAATDIVLGNNLNRRDNTIIFPSEIGDVLGKNTTGATLAQYSVVGLSSTLTPAPATGDDLDFRQKQFVFELAKPIWPDHARRWGILQDELANNETGRVRLMGVAIAKINGTVGASTKAFAGFKHNTTTEMEFNDNGAARVLYHETNTNWVTVLLGEAPNETFYFKSPAGGIPAASGTAPLTLGSATCTLAERYLDVSTMKLREISPSVSITVYNTVKTATAANAFGQGKWIAGLPCVDVIDCA